MGTKKIGIYAAALLFGMILTACGNQNNINIEETSSLEESSETNTEDETDKTMTNKMNIQIGDSVLTATLEDNEAADELKKIIAEEGLTIQFSPYGGFEQVGSIGRVLPTSDIHTSTSAGDIMLYSGNQMVMFYGSHAWSYTRLGKIDASAEELENILGHNDVTAVFTLAEESKQEQEPDKNTIELKQELMQLEDGLSATRFDGNDGFSTFLEQGGADSDSGVVSFLKDNILGNIPDLIMGGKPFGCSTFQVASGESGYYFGRNFDWNNCGALIVESHPETGYASISTVNTDFIQAGGMDISKLPDQIQALIGLYAPLDGMNENGFAVSVNMIQDAATIDQNTEKPDITTTTAVRLLLNQASTVEEALALLESYDLHASMGMMVHFALADAKGNSVAVEYIKDEMIVTQTPIVTNFYLAQGEKFGIGTSQSHVRFDILEEAIDSKNVMTADEVRDVLSSVSKKNFGEFESTEWSIVMNQGTKEATWYHRENYNHGYTIRLEADVTS